MDTTKISEALIVAVDFTNGDEENGVMIVGRREENNVVPVVINAFQGKEAHDLYMKLITKIEKKEN